LVDQGKVSHTVAAQQLFPKLLTDTSLTPLHIAESLNLLQDSSTENLMEFVKSAVAKYPEKVEEYKNGKVGLIGLFMGEVMKMSKGKADPKVANSMMKDYLDSI
jgi:aspartyl-tRNA(Asn)/glutamyl-tRNA(Gln) amidotransferase subunit B